MSATKPTATAAPEPKRASPDKWAQATGILRRLARLDEAEQAELAQAPSDIRAKFEKKRDAALDGASVEVAEIVKRMRAGEAAE